MAGIDKEIKYIVSIDFGTTFSGFAFAQCSDDEKSIVGEIQTNIKWRSVGTHIHDKVPTVLLYAEDDEEDKQVNAQNELKKYFGYEAWKKFSLFENEKRKECYYFHHFKMKLHTKEVRTATCSY